MPRCRVAACRAYPLRILGTHNDACWVNQGDCPLTLFSCLFLCCSAIFSYTTYHGTSWCVALADWLFRQIYLLCLLPPSSPCPLFHQGVAHSIIIREQSFLRLKWLGNFPWLFLMCCDRMLFEAFFWEKIVKTIRYQKSFVYLQADKHKYHG